MNFFKIHKRPLISNDIKAQKDDIQDHYKEADKKLKNETAIIKSIILSKIESALEQVNIERDRLNEE
ncbi:TPA: hypothetical protein U0569_002030, partial [Streptococcus suis]|nr:hypothetical protein [Streptococcus suis]HEM2721359.1 hypothetical protein [Streptococcus suis]